ncbi:membrane protein [Nocardioides szechwanensis]|uniref:Peptidase_C39 like family protein n=1 Tax=Nocardioides szechwanensis TaxID=1005944 RepID=A0A1H0F8W5_9ACTN|nr:C39 family peptidase [Nocardioides szechwanensis]GEP36216.1 membrane protein [Nocardioides szechwanensis]SDN91147.1 Peptidase_C39 like family protein [Nocardioides szechwanensis]
MPRLLASLLTAALAAVALAPVSPVSAASTATEKAAEKAASPRRIAYSQWDTGPQFLTGTLSGTRVVKGRLGIVQAPKGRRTYAGRSYEVGRWVSPWTEPGFGLTELVASWEATTPGDSWVEVEVRGRTAAGTTSSYDVLGRWTSGDRYTRRQTVSGQEDDLAKVAVDTWRSNGTAGLTSWQLRVSLMRRPGKPTPTLDTVGAVASRLPTGGVTASAPGVALGTVLDVPRYSQMIHEGHYPQWGAGGEAWCSPTSASMVLAYYDALPEPSTYSYVPAGHPDPWVDHAARMTYDSSYDGTGNWPFNTAYAAPLAGSAFVTRLRSLKEAELFIAAGIPLVASIAFGRGELTGAPISSSDGHLLVIVGFTESGDVVVNDPAAAQRSGVRRTYDRGELENAWLPTTGGTVYVITDPAHPVPDTSHPNW